MQQHGSKYLNIFSQIPPPPRPQGSKDQNSTFSEHGHVAYQIKGNHKCSNMVANIIIFSRRSPPRPQGSKDQIQLFQNMVMLHIKLKGITNAATWKHIFSR